VSLILPFVILFLVNVLNAIAFYDCEKIIGNKREGALILNREIIQFKSFKLLFKNNYALPDFFNRFSAFFSFGVLVASFLTLFFES